MTQHPSPVQKGGRLIAALLVFLLMLTMGTTTWASSNASPSETLLPVVGDALVKVKAHDFKQVTLDLQQFEQDWKSILQQNTQLTADEKSAVENALASAKTAVQRSTPDANAVSSALSALAKATNELTSGANAPAAVSTGKKDMQSLSAFLQQSQASVQHKDWEQAKSQFTRFTNGWLRVESDVRSEDFNVYSNVEINLSLVHVALFVESPDQQKTTDAIQKLQQVISKYVNGKVSTT
jgi:high-affinity iron transporter